MNSKPNIDQAGQDSLQGGITEAIKRFFLNEFEGMLPAKVISYNDATNKAVIQPLVMIGTTDNRKISRASVSNIPVYRFGGGGFFMRFPIKAGDLGWLKANDRDISLIFQRGGQQDWPNTARLHKFSDAMFFPDTFKDWVIDGANSNAAVWQSIDGNTCISLHNGKVEITAANIKLVGNVETVGTLTNNGVNVGSTHRHANSGGTGTGGAPT